jgi:small subunit ribosomal protein S1
MDRSKGNVLVSRRRFLDQEKTLKRAITLETLKEGDVVKGKVTGLTNFGAFIDIGGIEGLLHVSDMDWVRVDNPKKLMDVGQDVDVKVLKHDVATHRISLGRKQLLTHPWEGIEARYPVGTEVKGKVTGLAPFGAFVEIERGIEGLIHLSELSWTVRVKHPQEVLKAGQDVEARVIALDRAKEKLSLSLKRIGANPWEDVAKKHPVGSTVEGEVSHVAAFGVFVKVADGVEALLKNQDLAWAETAAPQSLKVGDKIKAKVLEMDVPAEKMALGLKQLSADPLGTLHVGDAVTGLVTNVAEFGIFVKLKSGLDGLVRNVELNQFKSKFFDGDASRSKESSGHEYKQGDEVTASVININKKERKVELSIRRYERDQEKVLLKKYCGKQSNPTLGEATGWGNDDSDQ